MPNDDDRARDALARRLKDGTLAYLEMLTAYIGHRLGLYAALADGRGLTSTELAERAGANERYVREWLEQQSASGVLAVDDPSRDAAARRYRLPRGHAEVLADRESLHYAAARPQSLVAVTRKLPRLLEAFRHGGGVLTTDPEAREAQAELGRVAYLRLLGTSWIPAMPDVEARLRSDPPARVADVGCGGGWSAIALALTYAKARVDGFDVHEGSIEMARRHAEEKGVADRVRFHVQDAAQLTASEGYDLVMAFETLHDMSRPVEALRVMRRLAGAAGAVVIVDEKVADAFEAPADPATRLNYAWSVLTCLSSGLLGEGAAGTGTVMRKATLERYAREAGFASVDALPVEHEDWRFYRLRA